MYNKKPKVKDEFSKTAITFILGVLIGFSLLLLGIVFFMIGILTKAAHETNPSPDFWYILGIISAIIGILMMRKTLQGVPEPGTYK